MNVDLGIWRQLTRLILILLAVAALLGIGVWYLPLIRQNQALRQDGLRLDVEIQKEEAIARQQKATINALQKDPKTIERLAREKLGFARTGETVIRFEPPTTNLPASRP
jgi:cell division protein FtsB